MDIEHTLKTVVNRLGSGLLENEAQVKQAVILPILRALDWDDSDPNSFKPEYRVDKGLVDYALLNYGQPVVFIEAKRTGNLDISGENQLFKYSTNQGVPFLILTDGNRWDFYLSMAEGIPQDRRFYRLELQLDHKMTEYMIFLKEHLGREQVVSGKARTNAEKRHASNRGRERARKAIPGVWQSLLNVPDETLRDLLAETVESECGTKPELDDVEIFLRDLASLPLPPMANPKPPPRKPTPTPTPTPIPSIPQPSQPSTGSKIVGFVLGTERVESGTARGTLADLLMRFDSDDPKFMERLYLKTVGRTRRLVARNRADLYDKIHLADRHAIQLDNGWWLGTNLSQSSVRRHIETACSVAGVEYNVQLKLIER